MNRIRRSLFVLVWCVDKTLAAVQVAQQASAAAKRFYRCHLRSMKKALDGTSR